MIVEGVPTITTILDKAVTGGMAPEALEKIVALYERVADRQASQEFSAAMAEFQAACPPIAKTSTAKIVTNSGANYSYKYAELDEIARTVRPLLHKHGLSYSWDSVEDKGLVVCTCIIRHENGHSVSAKFACPTDSAAKMSGAQKNAAALTYARRQSLIQALGLTTCDPDNDGAAAASPRITEHQAANLTAALDELNLTPERRAKFLEVMEVGSISKIPAAKFAEAMRMVEKARKAGK